MNEWNVLSDQEPEEDRLVIVTTKVGMLQIMKAVRTSTGRLQFAFMQSRVSKEDVVAWMYAPKRYKINE